MSDGRLPAGAPLPSTRSLAAEWAMSRTTVTAVYEQLAAEGFLVTSAGRVARVAASLAPAGRTQVSPRPDGVCMPALSAYGRRVADMAIPTARVGTPVRYDFLYGAVASEDFPRQAWRRAYQHALRQPQQALYYAAPEGDAQLRRALQGYLQRARGLTCTAEQIVIVQGAQQGIDVCARVLLDPGDALVMEEPGYRMARHGLQAYGAQVLAVAADAHGLDTDQLPTGPNLRLAYVTPSHQFPLGGVLPIARRQALLHWARQHDVWILEDDYDGEFRYGQRPIDALQALDAAGRVLYLGSFSKALSPQLRLGYLVLPPALVPVVAQTRRLQDRHAGTWEQTALAHLIETGVYERHVRRMRRLHERRRTALLQAIARHLPEPTQVVGSAAGLHVVVWLPWLPDHAEPALVAAARQADVGVYPVSPLYAEPPPPGQTRCAGLVLGYASLSPDDIHDGIERLGQVVRALRAKTP